MSTMPLKCLNTTVSKTQENLRGKRWNRISIIGTK